MKLRNRENKIKKCSFQGACRQDLIKEYEIEGTLPALPYDYTCFADGFSEYSE